MRIVHIVGARPQFVKYFPVSQAVSRYNRQSERPIENILIHTGQHYDYSMSEVFFKELGMDDPHFHLEVGSGSHGHQTGQILQRVEQILLKEKPDAIVVYGDTNSTLGGALAAVKLHIPVVHIEAGLRSYNKHMPEEINRVLTDHSSTVLLCPTKTAVENLQKEGLENIGNDGNLLPVDFDFTPFTVDISAPVIFNVGDVMYDVLHHAVATASERSTIIKDLELGIKGYSILTLHRAENTDSREKLDEIIGFVNEVSSGRPVIFPVHPRTKKNLDTLKRSFSNNVKIIEPLGYFDMMWLLRNSALIFTDSGGLQKEAYWLEVPCITLRDETEWIETVCSGWNILYKEYAGEHRPSDTGSMLYGDGNAAEKILRVMTNLIDRGKE